MGYYSNKAMSRDSNSDLTHPVKDVRSDLKGSKKAASKQERFAGDESRVVPKGTRFDVGNLVRVGPNTKGTDRLKVTSTVAESGKNFTLPAVNGVDGQRNRPNLGKVAPKRK